MESPEIQKIHQLLATKDDTSRFMGLALLKATLDNHTADLQHDQVEALWNAISPRYLDRLIRTGSKPGSEGKQAGHMVDVAVAVIYTFTKLLNNCAVNKSFYARIPNLVNAVLYSSEETTRRIVDLIHELVQQPDNEAAGGATCLAELEVDNWAPLIEVAPQHKTVFSIFHWTWTKGVASVPASLMQKKIDGALQMFISSFKGHDSVPLLDFIVLILDNLNPAFRPDTLQCLRPLTRLIQEMASTKQTADGRRAYTHCAAALLATYPGEVPDPLFSDVPGAKKPIAYLFVKMVQADILATLHILAAGSNTAEHASVSRRIAAALDIMTSFVGFLIEVADSEDLQSKLTPERIVTLHQDFVRAIGDIMEYVKDRWDAYQAGARGIEPAQASGMGIFEDPTIPAAIRLIAVWLRDDDGETLRTQACGLIELFAEIYKMNGTSTDMPDLRIPILAALEGILATSDGQEAFNSCELLSQCLFDDLRALISSRDADLMNADYIRGIAIIHTFHTLIENDENLCSHPASTRLLESIAQYDASKFTVEVNATDLWFLDFQTELLELAATLLDSPSSSITPAVQQKTRTALRDTACKVMANWGIVNGKDRIEKVASLGLI